MPNNALRSPAAQNLIAAAVAGVGILVRPARIPVWARRSLTVANTAGTAGSMLMTNKAAESSGLLGLAPVSGTRATAATTGSALAAAAGSLSLITSGIGLKLDAKTESYLTNRGVRRPRLWMAVGAVGLVFVIKTVQDAATRKAESTASKLAQSRNQAPAMAQVRRSDIASASKPPVTSSAASTNSPASSPASSPTNTVASTPATLVAGSDDPQTSAVDADRQAANLAETSTAATVSTTDTTNGVSTTSTASTAQAAADATVDAPIWHDVAGSAGTAASSETADAASATGESEADGATGKSNAADTSGTAGSDTRAAGGSTAYRPAHRPSIFEQQLAETTPENLDLPREGGN